MTVRGEIAEPCREVSARSGEGPSGKPACRKSIVAVPRLQQERS
jgi:hypothetical protein